MPSQIVSSLLFTTTYVTNKPLSHMGTPNVSPEISSFGKGAVKCGA